MMIHQYEFLIKPLICRKRSKLVWMTLCALFIAISNNDASASFVTYSGDATAESDWRVAAGNTLLEDFESYSVGTQISSLPALGIGLDSLAGGGLPNIYSHHECCVTPYGTRHLANFPNGINQINRWDDITLHVLSGYEISALGFWNGDGQRDTLVATVYDASDNILGTVGAFKGTFAGFTSDVAIARVIFDGNTGDGWNHLDGLQTNAVSAVPTPAAVWLLFSGAIILLVYRRHTAPQLSHLNRSLT